MNQSVATPAQIRAVLSALRKHRGLTQAEVGALIGVTQKRIARIEADPAKASFDQIAKLIVLLGGDLVVVDKPMPAAIAEPTGKPASKRTTKPTAKAAPKRAAKPGDLW